MDKIIAVTQQLYKNDANKISATKSKRKPNRKNTGKQVAAAFAATKLHPHIRAMRIANIMSRTDKFYSPNFATNLPVVASFLYSDCVTAIILSIVEIIVFKLFNNLGVRSECKILFLRQCFFNVRCLLCQLISEFFAVIQICFSLDLTKYSI